MIFTFHRSTVLNTGFAVSIMFIIKLQLMFYHYIFIGTFVLEHCLGMLYDLSREPVRTLPTVNYTYKRVWLAYFLTQIVYFQDRVESFHYFPENHVVLVELI